MMAQMLLDQESIDADEIKDICAALTRSDAARALTLSRIVLHRFRLAVRALQTDRNRPR